MKKAFKIIGGLIALFVLLIAGFALYINSAGIPTYSVELPENFSVTSDSAAIAEGARMVSLMCANCHTSEDKKLGGAYMADAKDFGEIYAPNISSHPDSKLSQYSDAELVYLLRTGIKRDGQYAPPYMPKLPNLSDKDMNDIIAFLRSDHPMMAASDNTTPDCNVNFLTKALSRLVLKPLPYPTAPVPEPDTNNMVEFGKYVSTAKFDCYQCHSEDFKTVNVLYPEKSPGFFAGGNRLFTKEGDLILSPNLTMDEETGIAHYDEESFVRAVRYGLRPNNQPALEYPMVPFTQMTDKEAKAIWAYLRTLTPVTNETLKKS